MPVVSEPLEFLASELAAVQGSDVDSAEAQIAQKPLAREKLAAGNGQLAEAGGQRS